MTVLLVVTVAGCGSVEPPPSCGAYTLDQGESIPQEAVECMAEGGEGSALRVTVPTVEGDPIVTTYSTRWDGAIEGARQQAGGLGRSPIEVEIDMTQDRYGGGTYIALCPDAVSVVDLRECEEQHRGD